MFWGGSGADKGCSIGTVMRAWMTMSSSMRIGIIVVMTRILMLMRSEAPVWNGRKESGIHWATKTELKGHLLSTQHNICSPKLRCESGVRIVLDRHKCIMRNVCRSATMNKIRLLPLPIRWPSESSVLVWIDVVCSEVRVTVKEANESRNRTGSFWRYVSASCDVEICPFRNAAPERWYVLVLEHGEARIGSSHI